MKQRNENFLFRILRLIDMFGVKPKLMYNNSSRYNSILGGFLSILVGITFALGFYAFGKEIFLKQLPTTIFSNEYYTSPERFNLTNDKFNFFIGIENINFEYYIDPSIINVKLVFNNITKLKSPNGDISFKYESLELKTEPCDIERHFGNLAQLFKDQPLKQLLCVDPEDHKKMFLEGAFGQDHYNNIQIQLSACENSTIPGSPICKPEEFIKKYLSGGFFALNVIDTIYNPKNYTNVNEYILRDFFTTLSNSYFKEFTFFFRNVDFVTDRGFLIEDQNVEKFLSLETARELIDLRSTPKTFFNANFRLSNFKDKHLRRYIKVQEVVAQIGGLIKGIILFITIIYSAYAKTEYYLELANSLYFFSQVDSKINVSDQEMPRKNIFEYNKSCIRMLDNATNTGMKNLNLEQNITTNNYIESHSLPNPHVQKNKFKKVETLSILLEDDKNFKSLKFSLPLLKILKIILPVDFKNKKIIFAKNLIKSIQANNNIENLLRLFEDFSQLKNFLLNEDQTRLFNLNSKIHVYDGSELEEISLNKQDVGILKEIESLQVNDVISINIKNQLLGKISHIFN